MCFFSFVWLFSDILSTPSCSLFAMLFTPCQLDQHGANAKTTFGTKGALSTSVNPLKLFAADAIPSFHASLSFFFET